MSGPNLTEERLRSWLDGNQPARERMCCGILALDKRFSEVRPRRPKGGPDGARDIEAVFEGAHEVWGAVGFRNSVSDSNADKKWVMKKKFPEDVHNALQQNSQLWGFAFFTNVDLTPADVTCLEEHAKKRGLSYVEIFYRERLRMALDSPRGLAFRSQYLGLLLSDAEQRAFFSEWREDHENLILRRFEKVDAKLARLEFQHECSNPIRGISVLFKLKEALATEQLGHFRILTTIRKARMQPEPALHVALRDAYMEPRHQGKTSRQFGVRCTVWSRNPDDTIADSMVAGPPVNWSHPHADGLIMSDFGSVSNTTELIEGGGVLYDRGPFSKLGDFDEAHFTVFVTKRLATHLELFNLWVDDYVLCYFYVTEARIEEHQPLEQWPEALGEAEAREEWVQLIPTARPSSFDFSAETPPKVTQSYSASDRP